MAMMKNVIAILLSVVLAAGSIGTAPVFAAEAIAEEEAEGIEEEERLEEEESAEDAESDMVEEDVTKQETVREEELVQEIQEAMEEVPVLAVEMTAEEEVINGEQTETEWDEENELFSEYVVDDFLTINGLDYSEFTGSDGQCGPEVTWHLDSEGTLVISGTGNMDNLGYKSAPWYEYNLLIKKVIIEEGVTDIGVGSFEDCRNLSVVKIPASVTFIGNYSFYGCESIESIDIPDSVVVIDDSAFSHCSGLKSLEIPTSVKTIESGAFWGCVSLTEVIIPDSVTVFGSNVFYDVDALFYTKKDSIADQYLTENGNQIIHICIYGHIWDENYAIDRTPSCIEGGSESIHCTVCGRLILC